ncbi:hypothetical protein [Lacinutrix jangbogonensis]|uniref:hypothetical protein n=1 Tax=Lacinutrix jangbogonensis TaxID=1469557 RepID=UPI00053DDE39|nr:hypothetical protein [Lacinutrix jangbogonensis]
MKHLIITFFCIISIQVFSQEESIIKLKKSYRIANSNKSITLRFPKKTTITLDTTIVEIDSSQLNFLKDFSLLDNTNFTRKYKWHAFGRYENRNITQIIGPVYIFLDEDLPKNIKLKFIAFIEDIPAIDNLSFSFTDDFEKANYFIDVLDIDVSAFTQKQKTELTENEMINDTFSEMTYKFYANENSKLISCHYKINRSIINDASFLIKLKKGFFRSLGNFFESKYAPKVSLLYNKPSSEIEFVTDYDIIMLKYHYQYLYNFKVNLGQFDTLIELRKQLHK